MTASDRATFGADHLARRLERAPDVPDCALCDRTGTILTGRRHPDGTPEVEFCPACDRGRLFGRLVASVCDEPAPPPHPLPGSDLYVPRGLSYGDRMPAAFRPLKSQGEIDREVARARRWRLDRIVIVGIVALAIAYVAASALRGALDLGPTLERAEARP